MALTSAYVLATKRIPEIFAKIRDGQAPDQLTTLLLKDWGFKSTNDRAFIPLLKALNFLNADGKPTNVYHNYRDHSQSKAVMAEALKVAYGDIFLIKAKPNASDKAAIEGKFKSFHNASENTADLMTKTFLGLLELADFNIAKSKTVHEAPADVEIKKPKEDGDKKIGNFSGLNYNIQIHLPATKDVEVYNSIFKSLREHLIEQ